VPGRREGRLWYGIPRPLLPKLSSKPRDERKGPSNVISILSGAPMRSRNAESGLVLIGFFDLRYDIVVDRNLLRWTRL
jgi:hypothetical protein